MDIVVFRNNGMKTIQLDTADLQKFQDAANEMDMDKCKILVRREINLLLDTNVVYFTNSMLVCMEFLLHKQFFDEDEKKSVTTMIASYEDSLKHPLDKHLHNAINLTLQMAAQLSNTTSHMDVRSYIRSNVCPQCNIRTMCYLHQILTRVILLYDGQCMLEASTFMDRVVDQAYHNFKYFSQFSGIFPSYMLQWAVKDIERQLQIYYEHRIKSNEDEDG